MTIERKLLSAAKIVAKIAFIIFAMYLVFKKLDFSQIVNLISKINLFFLLLGIICTAVSLVFSGLRSQYYFQFYGLVLSKKYMVHLYYIGTFFNLALPGGIGGDGYKIYHIHKRFNFTKLKAFQIILSERVNGFYVLVLLGLTIFYFSSFKVYEYSLAINTILLFLITPCYLWGNKFVLKSDTHLALKASLFSLIIQLLQIVVAICLLRSLSNFVTFINYIDFIMLFIIASLLSIMPVSIGGIGIRELTFLYGLEYINDESLKTLGVTFAMLTFLVYALVAFIGLPLFYKLKLNNFINK